MNWSKHGRNLEANRKFLELQMAPLTVAAMEPRRPQRSKLTPALLVAGLTLATVVVLAATWIKFPDQDAPLSAAYVARTSRGYEVGMRACAHQSIQQVEVRRLGSEKVIWVATAETGTMQKATLPLFQHSIGYHSSEDNLESVEGSYDVDVQESDDVSFVAELPVGLVSYPGSEEPITMDAYLQLPDDAFNCA